MRIKISSSVKQFEKKALKAWGLKNWDGIDDPDNEILFFGLFHDRDFEVFHNFKGKKSVFWCGGDILRLKEDYERQRVMRIAPETTHYCENSVQEESLKSVGIEPIVIPSFLGDIKDYPVSFKVPKDKWKIWMCGHPRRESEYGFDQARELAGMFSDIEFHFYGVSKDESANIDSKNLPNVIYHGLVSEKQLDREIKEYHAAIRANEHDGASEVVFKALLLGQYVFSMIYYPGVEYFETTEVLRNSVSMLQYKTEANLQGRKWVLENVNRYPWVQKHAFSKRIHSVEQENTGKKRL